MRKKVDHNQQELVDLFRSLGATVLILSDVGKGCPDILLGYRGWNILVELKNGKLSPSNQKLSEHEEKFHQTWRGQVSIVNNCDSAIALLDKYR